MMDSTRRKRFVLVGAVVALALLAGCAGIVSDDADPVEHAPDGSDALVHVDMSMLADEDNRELLEALAESNGEYDTLDDVAQEFENETGLDPAESRHLLAFGDLEGGVWDSSGGVVVYSEWETEAVVEAVENEEDTEYERTTYEGEDVLYEPVEDPAFGTPVYVGVLGDGQFVFGDEESVTASLDVEYGDADPVSGAVREAYDDARDGHVTIAVEPPAEQIPADDPTMPAEVDLEPFQKVNAISAVYYTDDGNAGVEATFVTESEDVALDVADVIDGAVSLASGSVRDEKLTDELREIEVEQDGATVTVAYQTPVDDIVALLEDEEL